MEIILGEEVALMLVEVVTWNTVSGRRKGETTWERPRKVIHGTCL
jgi:hypothetical protein